MRANSTAEARLALGLTPSVAVLLIAMLATADGALVYVPGRGVYTTNSAFRGEGKADAKDPKLIAETTRLRTDLSPVKVPDGLVVNLRQLTACRTDLMADRVRGVNHLRAMLEAIFPALEVAFDYSNRSQLNLVPGLCRTPAEFCAAGAALIRVFL